MSGIRTNGTNGTSGLHIRVPNRFLIWGGHGWIAGLLKDLLHHQGKEVYTTTIRMEDRDDVAKALEVFKPTHVLNAAGCTGRPNVDWCEDNKAQTYDEGHPIGGPGFKETDAPNFDGSFYSMTKAHVEPILASFKNVLILRLRMPVSDDLNPRNFVTKISKYEFVVDIPNSNTILHDLLPASIILAENKDTGVYNFTNPGAISHNEVLGLFKEIVRPRFTWENFSIEDQTRVIKAGRSNCQLDTAKLVKKMMGYGHEIPEVHEAYRQCFERMKAAGIQ
ncbi:uncharacterized protein FOBCDRAFT_208796 [Fusarium oxysporum Fo47]|uniref:dTDP-glucose 4,6-dehydratase n=1 Tax=Fusarium oxysporum Fo47 TaxID=660027 RepID=W9JEC7_FUSOX|nr:uncharacterized protein FOBCDRAFT_208796 [Fusarium oxysporum Fo47]EWZ30417.1 dTDP-glucose 4,6-dehydratase [Fusarium oxysporum Fo47]QKD62128.1 hypothetical protein FOBCDRAFT_208796 [Fusarium oxysporum Fo47]